MTHRSRGSWSVDSPLWPLGPQVCSEWVREPSMKSPRRSFEQEVGGAGGGAAPNFTDFTLMSKSFHSNPVPGIPAASLPVPLPGDTSQGSILVRGERDSGLGQSPVCSVQPPLL